MLAACAQGLPVEAAQDAGKSLFDARISGDLDQVLALYDEDFFKAHPRREWQQYLQHVDARLGHLQAYVLRKHQYDTRFSGRFYILEYQTTYEKGKAWERLTYVNLIGEQTVKLIAHQIKAEGL